MKKLAILTSMLALAACGGGSGGGGSHSPSSAVTPTLPMVPSSLAGAVTATDSNSAITSMNSEVIVSDASTVALSRNAHVTVDGVTFQSYRLEDIKLYAADSSHTDNGYLKIGMDPTTGRIENITMQLGEVGAPVDREGETEIFSGPIFEYVPDGSDQAEYRIPNTGQTADDLASLQADLITHGKITSGGHWNMVNEHMDVKTYGRDIGHGNSLQYSDFGHFNPVYSTKYKNVEGLTDEQMTQARNGTLSRGDSNIDKVNNHFDDDMAAEDYQLFAGGYAINGTTLNDTLVAPRNTTFKGMAIGRVYTSIHAEGTFENDDSARRSHFGDYGITDNGEPDDGHDIAKAFTTKEATMTVDASGKQTLYMPFYTHSDNTSSKFYDVTLVKNADGTMEDPQFTGTPTDAAHGLYDAENYIVAAESSFNPGYYGVNTATEAAGTARLYSEKKLETGANPANDYISREYELQAAYGMKKQ